MSLKKNLSCQLKNNKSLLAFNIQDINILNPLSKACLSLKKKAICQFSKRYFLHLDKFTNLKKVIKFYKKRNIYFFLDHCDDVSVIKKCIKYNFDGVMYDGSNNKIPTNILITNKIYKLTKKSNTVLESEIGPIYGNEDGFMSSKKKLKEHELINFINEAKFDLLAIGAGNTHGLYHNKNIDEELYKIAVNLDKKIKLVFHGGSGVDKKFLKKIQKNNIVKINFSSSIKKKMSQLFIGYTKKNKLFDIIQFNNYSEKNLIKFFCQYIREYS